MLLPIMALATWRMLGIATSRGGEQPGDAANLAAQVMAQAQAYRGDNPEDRATWDGEQRLKGLQGNDGGFA